MSDRKRNLTRRYATLDNAVIGLTEFMVRNGYVGDVCELYHKVTGRQLGTIKITAKGHLKINWEWKMDPKHLAPGRAAFRQSALACASDEDRAKLEAILSYTQPHLGA